MLGRLGEVNPVTDSLTIDGDIQAPGMQNHPDLSGTKSGELFGFFPGIAESHIFQLDRTTGATLGEPWILPRGVGAGAFAYAFAQWGGKFYVFLSTDADGMWSMKSTKFRGRARSSARTKCRRFGARASQRVRQTLLSSKRPWRRGSCHVG